MVKYYIVYKTTNSVNGKFYIGSHQTTNLEDGYLGSGRVLKKAIRKYGKQKFSRVIIANCIDAKIMRSVETQLVGYSITKFGRQCYNRSFSGTGAMLGSDNSFYGKTHTPETRKRIAEGHKGKFEKELNPFYGKTHTEDTKAKIRASKQIRGKTLEDILGYMKRSDGWFCTPVGCFYSKREAAKYYDASAAVIYKRCKNSEKFVEPNYQVPEKYWGRTWKENGFYYVLNEDRVG